MLNEARNHASVMRLSPPLMTISQRRDPNHQRPESTMRTEYDSNSIKVGKGHRHDSHLHLHLRDSRFSWTVLANLRSTAQQMWKRSYTISPSKENGQKNNKYLSTGGEVALILALVVGTAFMVLVTVFLVFRKRYGPRYTVRSFFNGLRPERARTGGAKTSSMPMFVEPGFPCKNAFPKRRGTKLTKTRPRNGQPATETNAFLMSGAILTQDQNQSQNQHQIQPVLEPGPARLSRQSSVIPFDPNRLSVPSPMTWSSYQPLHHNTQQQQQQQQQQEYNTKYNNNNNTAATTHRKQPPSPLRQLPRLPTTDYIKALTPTNPCSNRSRFRASISSSNPLPPTQSGMGQEHRNDPFRGTTTTAGDCRWSYCQTYNKNKNKIHDARSEVESEDRVVSLPSPSPILRNIIRPPPRVRDDEASSYYHVCRLMMRVRNGEERRSQRQSQGWEMDSRHYQQGQQEGEVPQPPLRYEQTGYCADDGGLPILPQSVFAVDSNQHRKPYGS